jgi:CheY-like chemotaxis protein
MVAKKILVVDDEADTRGLLENLLIGEGFDVVTCGAPDQAVRQALLLKPDLIILDLRMPKMGGMELLPRLQIAVPHSRIMILSAHADNEISQSALEQGVAGVLWKPFRTATLLQMISRILN